MFFKTIPYMEYVKTNPAHHMQNVVNLADSTSQPTAHTLQELGIDGNEIPLYGDNMYGLQILKESIAERYGVKAENILTSQGSSMANLLLNSVLLGEGDTILLETPIYECMSYPISSFPVKVEQFERKHEDGWRLPIEEIAEKVKSSNAKVVFLANPHNPSGCYTPEDEIIKLADSIGDSILLVDEIYREWIPDQGCQSAALKRPNIFITSSITKVWGLGGLRGGWGIASKEVVDKANRAYDHFGIVQPFSSEWLVNEIISKPDLMETLRQKSIAHIKLNRKHIDKFLNGEVGHRISTTMQDSIGFASWQIIGMSGDDVAERLLSEAGVWITPNRFFGDPESIRIAWTRDDDVIIEGMIRLEKWIRSL
jgi:aspartate/methionine/tyrosine aminotransferase